eukprot:CAMPEP_0174735262 /NCGR_PEP_ID=MMETSP1094-20130205/64655_1 /TAXON_ID=156173 /ORGANISM="Chrysochromulina brevifilum, Strain UTEX LB 985" /LENGTH=97 /DNA_ID=CAMNT_0015938201 /DNA_START=17 /DNA_END=310 /DNA_ORIENTATION=-
MNLKLSQVEMRPPERPPYHQSSTHIEGTSIRCVHLPGTINAPELLRARLRSIDQGRKQFRKRIKKVPRMRPPPDRLAPIVSTHSTQVDAHGTEAALT